MMTIAEAVEPLRVAAQDRAEKFAREYAERLLGELAAAGGDANISAPYPNASRMSRADYAAAKLRHGIVQRLTRSTLPRYSCRSPRDPDPREADPAKVEQFATEARADADRQYSAFVAKLESKVGSHSDARLTGNHVWDHSLLTVETPAGRQVWKTQQIVNVSKLGKVFNQWPTRRLAQ